MTNLLKTIIISEKRKNLLILLKTGTHNWDEIKVRLNVTATGMLPQIKILEDEHLVMRQGKEFSLTPMGSVIVNQMEPVFRTIEVFNRYKKFWQEHELNDLTPDILADIRNLGDYEIIENADENLFDISTLLNNISGAKSLKGITHTIYPQHSDFFLNMAKNGTKTSLILNPGVLKIMMTRYPKVLDTWLKIESSEFYVSRKDIRFSYLVTDSLLSLSLFYHNGIYDSKNEVVSRDPSALAWGERIFLHFQAQSDKIN